MKLEEIEEQYKKLGKEIAKLKKQGEGQVDSWEDLETIDGYFLNGVSEIVSVNNLLTHDTTRNTCHTKEQTESQRDFAMLTQLRDKVRGDWKPDWTDSYSYKYCIWIEKEKIKTGVFYVIEYFLAFETQQQCNDFLDRHEELIETYFKGLR